MGLSPSTPSPVPPEPKRSALAPCSWDMGASSRGRRRWPPALPARRRQAPACGVVAVYAFSCLTRTETQRHCPLLVGHGRVVTGPKALAAGTAGPQAASPCAWACRRLHLLLPLQNRNAAPLPPARGAWARRHGAEGAGCRHCRPAGGKPLRVGLSPSTPSPASPEPKRSALAPCSWGMGASSRSRRRWLPALPARRRWLPALPARRRWPPALPAWHHPSTADTGARPALYASMPSMLPALPLKAMLYHLSP